jgi:hypothetical protein
MNFVGLFVHVPAVPVRVCPSCAVPVIVGRTVFTGGDLTAAVGAAWTIEVGAETALDVPPAFPASTWKRIERPTSARSTE